MSADATTCECTSHWCKHGKPGCDLYAKATITTPLGTYSFCIGCADMFHAKMKEYCGLRKAN